MSVQVACDNWADTYDTDENLTRDLDRRVMREPLMNLRGHSVVEIGYGTGDKNHAQPSVPAGAACWEMLVV
jgi:ubiquinone/menaquinone biosynthesis C-methylase UbiE